METNNTLKQYYTKLHLLYTNAINLLTAINQALTSSASEISVNIVNDNDVSTSVRIPSFLYLENKVEELSSNMEALYDIPNSGEAWFNNDNGMYKLELIKSNAAPHTPVFNENNLYTSFIDNNVLRDLVSPKTFLKLNISNLTNNIENMYMVKYIIYNESTYNALLNVQSYDEMEGLLYNYNKGEHYDVYNSVLNLPIKHDKYNSSFKIEEIPNLENKNPWYDVSETDNHLTYQLVLDTLEYTNIEDSTITYTLKAGDKLTIGSTNTIYKVKQVFESTNTIILQEYIGHITLQTFDDNSEMYFTVYNNNYDEYNYVDIPLEENPYVIVFLGTIYNNVRSLLSKPLFLNLNNIYMRDKSGNYITDEYKNRISYIEYYKKYCNNIGDLILGLSEVSHPQIANFNNAQINEIQNGVNIKQLVSDSIDAATTLKVVPINKHLSDDTSTNEIISLHAQKSELNSQLNVLNANISSTYSILASTDFSKDNSITQDSLKQQLTGYYNERTELQQQIINVINAIDIKVAALDINPSNIKFRVRGATNVEDLETYLHSIYGSKLDIIGCEVEYKYKSISSDTTSLTNINSTIFTDWNRLNNIDKQRILTPNISTEYGFDIDYVNYNSIENIIKWNQIDIPIQKGEDVIIRVRYKYNVGQPFIDIYTPWSDEITVEFPLEYNENMELTTIISGNMDDVVAAKFNKTLINDGYQEHVNNKMIDGSQIYYHMPENIYSGFNTSTNKLISLKDKLNEMNNDLEQYKKLINDDINQNFKVYIKYDDNTSEISNSFVNKINILGNNNMNGYFIKKDINLIIKNTGTAPIQLYSIFPGNNSVSLLKSNIKYYEDTISDYERVPIVVNNTVTSQKLGQFIYFRQNNYYTGENFYYINESNNYDDLNQIINYNNENYKPLFNVTYGDYLKHKNKQLLLKYRLRNYNDYMRYFSISNENVKQNEIFIYWGKLIKGENNEYKLGIHNNISNIGSIEYNDLLKKYTDIEENCFYDWDNINNNILFKYSDIYAIHNDAKIFLDENTKINEFIDMYEPNNITSASQLTGAFLYPSINIINDILINSADDTANITISEGQEISVPLVLEYYIDNSFVNNNNTNNLILTKSIAFDIKPSLYKKPINYIIQFDINYNSVSSSNLYYNDTNIFNYDN